MELGGASDIDEALSLTGQVLAAAGFGYAITIVGGAALNLLGIVERTTGDVDILAFGVPRIDGAPGNDSLHEPPTPLPEPLVLAARTVARDLELDPEWLNAGPAPQWRTGLPPGLQQRVEWRQYSALWVGVVARYDLIFFKLFAAADSIGPRSVHYQDLLALRPSTAELDAAAAWVRTQDASPEFAVVLDRVVNHVRQDLSLT